LRFFFAPCVDKEYEIFIGVIWINFRRLSFFPPASLTLTLYYLYLHIILIVYLTALSSRRQKRSKNDEAKKAFFAACQEEQVHTNALWWTLLRLMMITIIIMNIFFSLSSDKWTLNHRDPRPPHTFELGSFSLSSFTGSLTTFYICVSSVIFGCELFGHGIPSKLYFIFLGRVEEVSGREVCFSDRRNSIFSRNKGHEVTVHQMSYN
jgi:hypothetical protein